MLQPRAVPQLKEAVLVELVSSVVLLIISRGSAQIGLQPMEQEIK
jgi:hypothetical protein